MSTISNERLEKLSEYDCADRYEVMSMATELLALRKEREKAGTVVNDERYQQLSELYHAQEKRLFKLAQRIKGLSFDKYAHSPSQAIDVLEAAIFGENDEDGLTAMLHSVMQPCDKCGLTGIHACMGGMETDTTSKQFESLAGKAVVPAGWKLVPIEPTVEMQIAFAEAWFSKVRCVDDCELEDAYIAMLAAAPEPCK
ncbi:hypothetical protein SMZ52_000922 [Cronobacter sakazakii]|nr:hypothetical protein [Cronobacter sakazakii]ELY4420460.1 hypothetical protein [Cronobacter sakazakii]